MGTKDFNILDKTIARMRLSQVSKHVNKGDTVLDFGCGNQAYLLNHLKDKINLGIGVDYDVDDKQIHENIKLIKGRMADQLPFEKEQFNTIYMLAVLEHIPLDEVEKLFKEFNRILKKGGKVVLTTPTPLAKPVLEFMAHQLKIISRAEIDDHKKYYTNKDIGEVAKECGYKIAKYKRFQLGMNSMCILEKV